MSHRFSGKRKYGRGDRHGSLQDMGAMSITNLPTMTADDLRDTLAALFADALQGMTQVEMQQALYDAIRVAHSTGTLLDKKKTIWGVLHHTIDTLRTEVPPDELAKLFRVMLNSWCFSASVRAPKEFLARTTPPPFRELIQENYTPSDESPVLPVRESLGFNAPKFTGSKRGHLTVRERKALHLNEECGGVEKECEYCLLEVHSAKRG